MEEKLTSLAEDKTQLRNTISDLESQLNQLQADAETSHQQQENMLQAQQTSSKHQVGLYYMNLLRDSIWNALRYSIVF